ncbi:MAG: CarD family transcriptional regulator [Pseudomonadota bacterium]
MAGGKKTMQRQGFKTGEFVVYPAHGVGQITAIEEQEVAGYKLELFVINFAQDKLTLRVPVTKIEAAGMRKLSDEARIAKALKTVQGRARIKRTMWSRRAQEYEAKINSGDLISIAEVVRDLFRSENQPEQSYSERQLYEAALDRMVREISAVNKISATEAAAEIEKNLLKNPRKGPRSEEEEQEEAA